ncbi:hypothetical protein Q9L58_010083 [Maublancomyces gigas]|uniref:Uncharacterized protein n=1 Tax=Discina gigas TaxID=1032678 RepID=A0ABR3G596_9PEZI
MSIPPANFDHYKLETSFHDGYVVSPTYEWKYSQRRTHSYKTWRRQRLLGSGTFGAVWLEREDTGQLRAIKILHRGLLPNSQQLLALITLAGNILVVYEAVQTGRIDTAKMLLANITNVNSPIDCATPIEAAVNCQNIEMLELLLDHMPDINAPVCLGGMTVLVMASESGYLDVVRLLLDKGAHTGGTAMDRQTPLQAAGRCGHTEIVDLLLVMGAGHKTAGTHRHGSTAAAKSGDAVTGNLRLDIESKARDEGNSAQTKQISGSNTPAGQPAPINHHRQSPEALNNLRHEAQTRYNSCGDLADLHEAIWLAEQGDSATNANDPHRPSRLSNLGYLFGTRFGETGDLSDIDRAIQCCEDAQTLAPPNYPDYATLFDNFRHQVQTRYKLYGGQADLQKAIFLAEQGDLKTSSNHPDRPSRLANLDYLLGERLRHQSAGE